MHLFCLIVLVPLLCCCGGSQFRSPVCPPEQWELPQDALGIYRVTTSELVETRNNTLTRLNDAYLKLSSDGAFYELSVDGSWKSLPDSGSPPLADLFAFTAACRIGEDYYLQRMGEHATYSLSRIDAVPTGLAISLIALDYEDMRRQGFRVLFIPRAFENALGIVYRERVIEIAHDSIVDNMGLNPAQTEKLLALSRTDIFSFFLKRVDAGSPGSAARMMNLKKIKRFPRSH